MTIVVFSDSHGDADTMRQVIDKFEPETVLYLGDGIHDVHTLEKELPGIRFEYVKGNCDVIVNEKNEKTISVDGHKFYITHGDRYQDALQTDVPIETALECGASAFLHGHTHVPTLWTCKGITVMNPGSIRRRHDKGRPSFGLIKTFQSHFICKIIFI